MRLAVTRFAALALVAGLSGTLVSAPAQAQDAAELVVRMNRLEGQVRQMSGQIEQLQFENRQLKEQARKFQEDVEYRFSERSGGARSSAPTTAPGSSPAPGPAPRPTRRSDAFDPDQEPGAVGAPRPLGQAAPHSPTVETGANPRRQADTSFSEGGEGLRPGSAPLDLGAAARGGGGGARPSAPPSAPTGPVAGLNPSVAGLNPGAGGASPGAGEGTRAEYDAAYALVAQKHYDQAEPALKRFISAHPRDKMAADATYWLGESYLQRSKPREAAEQFLKVSTDYTRSAKAPEAFLKLGMSLSAIGAKDQACATFAELERKYPTASSSVKKGVDREQKRARCT